jgi:hypothetical protein
LRRARARLRRIPSPWALHTTNDAKSAATPRPRAPRHRDINNARGLAFSFAAHTNTPHRVQLPLPSVHTPFHRQASNVVCRCSVAVASRAFISPVFETSSEKGGSAKGGVTHAGPRIPRRAALFQSCRPRAPSARAPWPLRAPRRRSARSGARSCGRARPAPCPPPRPLLPSPGCCLRRPCASRANRPSPPPRCARLFALIDRLASRARPDDGARAPSAF